MRLLLIHNNIDKFNFLIISIYFQWYIHFTYVEYIIYSNFS